VKPLAAEAETAAEQPADEASPAGSPLPAVDRQTAAAAGPEPAGSEAAPIQPTGPQSGELATTGPALATETPAAAFLQDSPKRNRKRSAVLISSGAVLLALLLLAQLAVAYRAEILVNFPQARPALGQLCKVFRCTVNWPTRGDLLAVIGTELQALPGTGAFELTAVVRNRGTVTLALPAIELTLSDTLNRIVARKVFAPADYLIDEADPSGRLLAGLEAGADLTIRIAFEAGGLNAAGFVVYPFYL